MKILMRILGLLLVIFLAAAAYILMSSEPIGPFPGGELSGTVVPDAIDNWAFINDLGLCQVEVNPQAPHSINAFCFESQQNLYVGCMRCPGKTWAEAVQADPNARIRFGQNIYPVSATRITDEALRDQVWADRHAKNSDGPPDPTPEDWWLFNMVSR